MTDTAARDGALRPGPGSADAPDGARSGLPGFLRKPPSGLVILSAGVAAMLLMPLAFLLIEAAGAGVGQVASLIDRPLTVALLWNTIRLASWSPRCARSSAPGRPG